MKLGPLLTLMFVASFAPVSFAQTTKKTKDSHTAEILQNLKTTFDGQKKFADLLEWGSGRMTAEDLTLFKAKLSEFKNLKVPTLTILSANSFELKSGTVRAQFVLLSATERTFKINGHELDFSNEVEADRKWMLIEEALNESPISQSPFWFRLMLPQAHAVLPGVLAAKGAIQLAAWLGAVVWAHDYHCREIRTAGDGCIRPLRKMAEAAEALTRENASRRNARRGPNAHCPREPDTELEDAAEDAYQEARRQIAGLHFTIAQCHEYKKKVEECPRRLVELAKVLCMKSITDQDREHRERAVEQIRGIQRQQ